MHQKSVNASQNHRSHRVQSDFAFPPLVIQRWFSEQPYGEKGRIVGDIRFGALDSVMELAATVPGPAEIGPRTV